MSEFQIMAFKEEHIDMVINYEKELRRQEPK